MTRSVAQRYVLEESLGHGGMGEVYRAFDTVAGRRVALKLLKPATVGTERSFHQFKQEFRMALSLRHPHLVQVHDFGQDQGAPFFTMELVEGPPVATGRPYPVAEACDILAQALQALELLHSRGVLHRDVKPDNLRFSATGELKLLDLGLLEPIGVAGADQISGTIAYLPPEALIGRPLTPAADLYSVGVLAYELLCGRHPFAAVSRGELLTAILQVAPSPLTVTAPALPPELARLVEHLMAKEPADRPQRASDVMRALAPWLAPQRIEEGRRQAHSYLLAPGLVGRISELAWLMSAVNGLKEGRGGAAFVGASAGVGKSRLIQEVRVHCQMEDIPFVTARCTYEGGSPYAALRQMLRGLLPLAPERVLMAYQPLVSAVMAAEGGLRPLPGVERAEFHADVAAFIAAVTQARPAVLFIDDLQWADTLSLQVMVACLETRHDENVLWLGTYRPDEVGPRHLVSQALMDGLAQRLVLGPFEEAEVAQLVAAMLGTSAPPDGLLPLLRKSTQGNGFFLAEMLRYLVDRQLLQLEDGAWRFAWPDDAVGLPDSIEQVITQRVARLSSPAQALARLAAVLADDVPTELLALADLPEQVMLDAVSDLLEHHVWVPTEQGYRFAHDRLRESIYQSFSQAERQTQHQAIGEWLERRGAGAASLAFHFAHGHDERRGVKYLRRAGLEAEAVGAMHEAFRHWRQAAELLEGHPEWDEQALLVALWLDLGTKCGFSVDSRVGEEALDKAHAVLTRLGRPELAARAMGVALRLIKRLPAPIAGPVLAWLGRPVPFKMATGWQRWLPPNYLALVPLLIESHTYLTICCNTNGRIAKALEVNRQGQRLVPDRDSWAWGVVMTAYAYSLVLEGRFEESVRTAREAFRLLKDETNPQAIDLSCGALVLANNQVYQGMPIEGELRDELLRRASSNRMTEWEGMVQYAAMVHFALTGRASEALAAIETAQPLSRRCGRGTVLEREIVLATARVRTLLGEFDEALAAIEGGIRLDEVVALPYFTTRLYEVRGRVHLERRDLASAARDFAEVIAREERYGLKFTLPEAHLGLSEVARLQGDMAKAEAHWHAARAIIEDPAFSCAIKRIYLGRQAGWLEMAAGRWTPAAEAFEAALSLAEAQQNPWQAALLWSDMGQLALRRDDQAAAREAFQRAMTLYHEIDNPYGQAQVRRLLATLGAPQAPIRGSGLDRLAVLQRFSVAVAEAHSVEAVLETLVIHAMDAIGGQRGAILQVRPHRIDVVIGREGNTVTVGDGLHISQTVVREAMASGAPLLVADAMEDELLSRHASVANQAVRTLICVPLDDAHELALYADRQSLIDGGLDQGHVDVLHSLVHFGRLALQNVRLLEQAHARTERLQMLNQVSLLVTSSLDLTQMLDRLLEWVLTLTGAELALVISTEGAFEVLGARGSDASAAFSRTVVRQVVESRQPICVLDSEVALGLSESVQAMKVRSVMCVPLEIRDDVLGVLYVSSRASARAFTEAELDLLRAIAANSAMAIRNARQLQLIQDSRAMEFELTIAQRIQQGFYPERVPSVPGLLVSGACQAAREVGGDFYDVVLLPDGRVALTLGDVSGKSISAALYMAVARTALRMTLARERSPRACLVAVNDRIAEDIKDGSFITCFLGFYDPATGEFLYASAGHHLSLVLGRDGPTALSARGLPLGLDPEAFAASIEERTMRLAPGDRIVLFTDGVIEALSPKQEEFGEEAFLDVLLAGPRGGPGESLEAVLRAISDHVAEASPFDDMTLVVADVGPPVSPVSA